MSISIELVKPQDARTLPVEKPLDEEVFRAWLARGHAREQRSRAVSTAAVKWIAIAALLATAGLSPHVIVYELVVRFVVAAAAVAVMLQAFHARHFVFLSLFGVLAVLYNPVIPIFRFSGDWQRIVVIVTALPFFLSLRWTDAE